MTSEAVSRSGSRPVPQPLNLSLSHFRKIGYLKFLEDEKKKFTNGLDNIKLLNLKADPKKATSFMTNLPSNDSVDRAD